MNNVPQPHIDNQKIDFLALSTFYYIGKYLHMTPTSNKKQYRDRARELCTKHYDAATAGRFDHLPCIQASFGYYLLNSFGFPKDWNIDFIKKVDGVKVGWTLGLMYTKKGEMYDRFVKYATSLTYHPEFVGLAVFGVVAMVGGAIFFLVYRKRMFVHDELA